MLIQMRTMLAYTLIAVGFVLTVPWCAGIAWFVMRGVAELTGLLFTLA